MASPPIVHRLFIVPVLVLGMAACAPATSEELPRASTEGASAASGCTGTGSYRVVFSVPGSTPALPQSSQGQDMTPVVGLAGTRADGAPPSADLSLFTKDPRVAPVFFDELPLGGDAALNGYIIRVTSICEGEVRFDLVSQPAPTNASCTGAGTYLIAPSANGSFPLLPATSTVEPPVVRLSSTHLKSDPVTADLSVALFSGGSPASKEFRGLAIGQQAFFEGYTIKITSICEGEVLFDLMQQPG